MAEELNLDHFDLGTFVDYGYVLKQERDAAIVQVDALRQALTKIHYRCEAFVRDDSGMQVHSVEVLMDIAARGLDTKP